MSTTILVLSDSNSGYSFESIDPTPCRASAHPQKHESTVAFSVTDFDPETPSTVTVSEITTRHIRRLVGSASDFLGKKINAAVISVPTNFGDAQKAALTQAAEAAGVEVLQTISEPTAALLAYDARSETKTSDKVVVVADIGGTRSDITVLASRGGIYTILATSHDYETAGTQLDQVLIDHFAKEFLKKNKDAVDPRSDPKALAKLTLEAESVKKSLSIGSNATLSIEALSSGLDFSSTINRTRYEMLSAKVFSALIRLVFHTIAKASLDLLDVDEVILSGGASHTPRLATSIADHFKPEKTTFFSPATSTTALDPSSLAARGAAIQASLVSDYDKQDIEQNTHPMCTATPHLSHALGVMLVIDDLEKGVFYPIIERETPVPCRRSATFGVPPRLLAPKNPTTEDGGKDAAPPKADSDGSRGIVVRVVEATSEIRETLKTKEPKPPKKPSSDADSNDDEDSEDDDVDDPELLRESIWKVGNTLAELAVSLSSPPPPTPADTKQTDKEDGKKDKSKKKDKDTTKDKSKPGVEVTIDVAADMALTITAREVGGKGAPVGGGVRGQIRPAAGAGEVKENGSV